MMSSNGRAEHDANLEQRVVDLEKRTEEAVNSTGDVMLSKELELAFKAIAGPKRKPRRRKKNTP